MNKLDVKRLRVGDHIALKHNLGRGHVTQIAWEHKKGLPENGRYPMIQFSDEVLPRILMWSTYLIVETVKPKLRSVT